MGSNVVSRVVVLGFDGASFHVVKGLMDDGLLPNFQRLRRSGVFYNFKSCIPPITYPAWTSLFTGKNPGKHGIFDFITYDGALTNASHRRSKAIWELLSDEDISSYIIHIPASHPPDEIKGRMISRQFIPPDLSKEEPFSTISMDLPETGEEFIVKFGYKGITNPRIFLIDTLRIEELRLQLLLKLMEGNEWNLAMINFGGLDELQHLLWGRPDAYKQIGSYLVKAYNFFDKIIGSVIKNMDLSSDVIFLVSDHGFGPVQRTFNIDSFLRLSGFATNSKYPRLTERIKQGVISFLSVHEKMALGLNPILENMPYSIKKVFLGSEVSKGSIMSDFSRKAVSRALTCFGSIAIQGYENTIEKPRILTEIISKLISLKDPETGVSPIEECYLAREVFSGPFSYLGPDIIFKMIEGYEVSQGRSDRPLFHSSQHFATHRPEGILFVSGKGIIQNVQGNADIYDITPTLLHILDCPIPHDVDGNVLKNIFNDCSQFNREVKYGKSSMTLNRIEAQLSSEEEGLIKERLKKLGYFG